VARLPLGGFLPVAGSAYVMRLLTSRRIDSAPLTNRSSCYPSALRARSPQRLGGLRRITWSSVRFEAAHERRGLAGAMRLPAGRRGRARTRQRHFRRDLRPRPHTSVARRFRPGSRSALRANLARCGLHRSEKRCSGKLRLLTGAARSTWPHRAKLGPSELNRPSMQKTTLCKKRH